ncbi:hypothetical protein Tco_0494134 [Tanacetum coccineum]
MGKTAINPSYLDKTPVLKNSFPVAWRILFTFVIQVLNGNYSSTEQVNSIKQLLAYSLITGTEVDIGKIIYSDLVTKLLNKSRLKYVSYPRFISCALQVLLGSEYTQDKKFRDLVSPPPLVAKLKKGKSQTVAPTLPKSQGLEASGALSKKRKKPKSKIPPTETKERIQLTSTGLPSTLDEGTRQSKPLPEGTATHPKYSGGNKQPLDRDITSTTSNEGMAKTTPRPEGSLGDKDLGGNIPPADMEQIHTPVADLLGTGAKYQEDQTQSSRLRYQSLTKNKGEPSYEGEPDTQPMLLTYADVRAILLSEDEAQESDEEVLAARDDMDEDLQDDKEVRTPSPKQDQPEQSHVQESASDSSSPDLKKFDNILPLNERQLIRYLRKMSRVLFNRITEKQWEQHEEAAVSYADLKASVDQYYDENIAHRDQTDKLVEASMSSLDRSSTTISDLYKGLNVITQLLKEISNAVKDDPATNQKLNEATETFVRISSNVTKVLSLVKGFDFSILLSTVKSIQDHVVKKEEASTAWMKTSTNMAWNLGSRILSRSLLFSSLRQCHLALTDIQANVERENANTTAIEEPPSYTEGETEEPRLAIPISSIPSTIDKGKGIATESGDDPSKKLVKASSIVCPDPNEPVRVVREEAKKLGIHPKEAITTKACELFKKAQDAKHEVLKKQHTKKVTKSLELRMHKYDSYMWTVSSRLKPEPITDIKIHRKPRPVVIQSHPSSAPSGNVTPILALTDIQANVEGENANTTAIKEPPSHTEGDTEEPRLAIPISSILSTIDKGKGIATESDDGPSKKLVKASSIVHPDPDEPVRVEFIINGRKKNKSRKLNNR